MSADLPALTTAMSPLACTLNAARDHHDAVLRRWRHQDAAGFTLLPLVAFTGVMLSLYTFSRWSLVVGLSSIVALLCLCWALLIQPESMDLRPWLLLATGPPDVAEKAIAGDYLTVATMNALACERRHRHLIHACGWLGVTILLFVVVKLAGLG